MNLSDFYLIDQIRILYEASFIKHRVKRIDRLFERFNSRGKPDQIEGFEGNLRVWNALHDYIY